MDPYLRRRLLLQHAQEQRDLQLGFAALRRVDDIVDANRRPQGRFVDMVLSEYHQHQHHDHNISGCRYPCHHPNCRYAQTNHAHPSATMPTHPQHPQQSYAPDPAASTFRPLPGPSNYQQQGPGPVRQPPPLRRSDDEDWLSNYPSRVPHAPDPPRRSSSPWPPTTNTYRPPPADDSAMFPHAADPYRLPPPPRPASRYGMAQAGADPYRSPPPRPASRSGIPQAGRRSGGPYPPARSGSRASPLSGMETVMAMRREGGSYRREYGDTARSPRRAGSASPGRTGRVHFDDEDDYDDADRWW